jgi:hypothetical protein
MSTIGGCRTVNLSEKLSDEMEFWKIDPRNRTKECKERILHTIESVVDIYFEANSAF